MKSNKLTALNVLNYIFIFVVWTWPFWHPTFSSA